MRVETVLTIKLDAEDAERLTPPVADLVAGAKFTAGSFQVRFHHAADTARRFIEVLDEIEVDYGIHEERSFSVAEIERAPALHIARSTSVAASQPGLRACPHRLPEAGPEQTPAPELRDAPETLARTATGGLMVDEQMAALLIRNHITGCLLRPAREAGGALSKWFEVLPIHRLPPMHSPPTRFIHEPERACPECGGAVPMALVTTLADVGDYFDPDNGTPCDRLPADHFGDPAHRRDCSHRSNCAHRD